MRTLQKIIRRANLPVEYSKGFNPHMSLSIAQPLSVGMSSKGEYLDLGLLEELSEKEIKDRLIENTPSSISILEVKKVVEEGKKVPAAMALIDRATYEIKVYFNDTTRVEKELEELLKENSWKIMKKSKKGEKEVDIRPLIKDIKYWCKDSHLIINCTLPCGSREHLSPELLATYIKGHIEGADEEKFTYIERKEMYAEKNERFIPLYKYV